MTGIVSQRPAALPEDMPSEAPTAEDSGFARTLQAKIASGEIAQEGRKRGKRKRKKFIRRG